MFDVAVIGAGPGGYVAAIRAAQLGLKVACIDKRQELGGTCLNVGCIPSKALLYSSELYFRLRHEAKSNGIETNSLSFHFPQMMERKAKIVSSFNAGISALFKKYKITQIVGHARFQTPTQLVVLNGPTQQEIHAKHVIIATGSTPIPLPFLPFDEHKVLSSTGALSLGTPLKKLVIIGAGIIGVELGSVYARLGTEVIFIEFLDRICPTLDRSLSSELQKLLETQGMRFYLSTKAQGATVHSHGVTLKISGKENTEELLSDAVLISIGRKAYTEGLGLETIGIPLLPNGTIPVNGQFRTTIPHIFAIGDTIDGPMLAHKASEEGTAVAEIIAGHSPHIHYAAIPSVVYTHPEVASVGLSEEEANTFGIPTTICSFPFKANSRARCTGEEAGFVKIVADAQTGRLLGMHIVGAHASESIAEGALAIQHQLTVADIANTPHAHPTLSETIKEAALAQDHRAIHR